MRSVAIVALACLVGAMPGPRSASGQALACDDVVASKGTPDGADSDCPPSPTSQDRARAAMLRGDIAPLSKAIDVFHRRWPGDILRIELEKNGERFVYEAKILDGSGRRREIILDAKSLESLNEE